MSMHLMVVIDREMRDLAHALKLDPDSLDARRDLTACGRIRARLLVAVAQFRSIPGDR
jgi:hypothetical protein